MAASTEEFRCWVGEARWCGRRPGSSTRGATKRARARSSSPGHESVASGRYVRVCRRATGGGTVRLAEVERRMAAGRRGRPGRTGGRADSLCPDVRSCCASELEGQQDGCRAVRRTGGQRSGRSTGSREGVGALGDGLAAGGPRSASSVPSALGLEKIDERASMARSCRCVSPGDWGQPGQPQPVHLGQPRQRVPGPELLAGWHPWTAGEGMVGWARLGWGH